MTTSFKTTLDVYQYSAVAFYSGYGLLCWFAYKWCVEPAHPCGGDASAPQVLPHGVLSRELPPCAALERGCGGSQAFHGVP
jgi:hypothetical protein